VDETVFCHVSSTFDAQDEEEQSSSKASKATQKRARKKAAAKQAAGAAVAAMAAADPPPPPSAAAAAAAAAAESTAIGISHCQPHNGTPRDAQTEATQPSIAATAADMQRLGFESPSAAAATSKPPTDPPGQQSADDWMVCPLTKVSERSVKLYVKHACVCSAQQDSAQQDHIVTDM
jgi:hypothetical protein